MMGSLNGERPTEPEVSALAHYEANAQTAFDRSHAEDLHAFYSPFLALLPAGARILDAGCGSGRDSLAFLALGYAVTAFDGAAAMAEMAARHIRRPVLRLRFQDVNFNAEFDGVWASRSLLHVARREMPGVLGRLTRALKPGGVLYASFMLGDGERRRGGVFFNDYTEEALEQELATVADLALLRLWRTADPPPSRPGVTWLHALVRRHQPDTTPP